jgi:hypothetical protein
MATAFAPLSYGSTLPLMTFVTLTLPLGSEPDKYTQEALHTVITGIQGFRFTVWGCH